MCVLHIKCGAETHCISGHIVGEDDRAHGCFPRAALAHEENLFFGHAARIFQPLVRSTNDTIQLEPMRTSSFASYLNLRPLSPCVCAPRDA